MPPLAKSFERTLQQIDLALLVRETREEAGLTQAELARKIRTTQSVIARLEDAEYAGHSLMMIERVATACGVALKLHAENKPSSEREVALVQGRSRSLSPPPDANGRANDGSVRRVCMAQP